MGLDDLPKLLETWPHSREKWLGKYSLWGMIQRYNFFYASTALVSVGLK